MIYHVIDDDTGNDDDDEEENNPECWSERPSSICECQSGFMRAWNNLQTGGH